MEASFLACQFICLSSLPPSHPSPCFSFALSLPATLILPSHSAAAQSLSLRETLLLSRRERGDFRQKKGKVRK